METKPKKLQRKNHMELGPLVHSFCLLTVREPGDFKLITEKLISMTQAEILSQLGSILSFRYHFQGGARMQTEMGLTKTDRVLIVVLKLLECEEHWIQEREFFELLGNPSRSQRYKLLNDLTTDKNGRPAVFVKNQVDKSTGYSLSGEMKEALGR